MDYNNKKTQELVNNTFIKVFANENGELILDYLTWRFQENLEPDLNNINNNYYKMGQSYLIKYIKQILINFKNKQEKA